MRWLREPLVQFLALGAGLFLLFALFGDSSGRDERVVVSTAQVQLLTQEFARARQRPPSGEEVVGLVEEYVRGEIYYREALAMGLDRDDAVVRERLRQKFEYLANDLIEPADPTARELLAYLEDHSEAFRVGARVTFRHVYFNRDQRGEAAVEDARRLRERLATGEEDADLETLGDRLPLPRRYRNAPTDKLASRFGFSFVERLGDLAVGEWSGPVESAYGLHLVRIESREAGRVPELEEVRAAVEREWRTARREEAKKNLYRELRERYTVIVEEPAASPEGTVETSNR